jgi:hypothetical protein
MNINRGVGAQNIAQFDFAGQSQVGMLNQSAEAAFGDYSYTFREWTVMNTLFAQNEAKKAAAAAQSKAANPLPSPASLQAWFNSVLDLSGINVNLSLPGARTGGDDSTSDSIPALVNASIASGNLLAANSDGMFTDGSLPWVSGAGSEASAAGMGGRSPAVIVNVTTEIRPPYVEAGVKSNQTVIVDPDSGMLIYSGYSTGTTQLFGISFSARQLGTSGFSATSTLQNGSTYVNLNGETGSKFVPLNINYNFRVGYNPNTQSATVIGTHDGFPSYIVTVNGTQILNFQQTGGVLNLAGSGDVKTLVPPTKVGGHSGSP